MTNTEISKTEIINNNIAIEEEIEAVEHKGPEKQKKEETNKNCSFENTIEIIFKNNCCDVFYNNRCFNNEFFKPLIAAFNIIISFLITLGFSIYMLFISIIITFNIDSIENKLKLIEREDNDSIIVLFRKLTTTTTIYIKYLGNITTYEEAKNLKIVSIVFNIIIFLLAIFLPLCITCCCSSCIRFLNLLKVPILIIGYIIGYIVFNIQYHIVYVLNITELYNNIIVLHIFTGITLLYIFYLIGYFINVEKHL